MSLFRQPAKSTALALTLYTRADCPLCDSMSAELERLLTPAEALVTKVSIDTDPELGKAYGWRIPVLAHEGEVLAEGLLVAKNFLARLAALRERQAREAHGTEH